jgi:hypothetical protein
MSAADDVPGGPSEARLPLWQQAASEVLTLVVETELARLLGRKVEKPELLAALAARRELADRMNRHRWLAIEAARSAGASWAEIDVALDAKAGAGRREYETVLARQKAFGFVDTNRADPGRPEL